MQTLNPSKQMQTATQAPDAAQHRLQVWAEPNHRFKPDLFQLEDGRLVELMPAQTVGGDRTKIVVWLHKPLSFRAFAEDEQHRKITGCAGDLYQCNKTGAWELVPLERSVTANQRRLDGKHGCKGQITRREAALRLIELSDWATRNINPQIPTHARNAGAWLVWRLQETTNPGFDQAYACDKRSVPFNRLYGCGQQYLALHKQTGEFLRLRHYLERHPAGGYQETTEVVPSQYKTSQERRTVPKALEHWVESRVRYGF